MLYKTTIQTQLGTLYAIADNDALLCLQFSETNAYLHAPASEDMDCLILQQVRDEIMEYFTGNLTNFSIPIRFHGTPFQIAVWNALRTIPYGTTCSYQDIAHQIENASAARAVGNANGANPILIIIPCHRVITASGTIGGYTEGVERKRYLLNLEL